MSASLYYFLTKISLIDPSQGAWLTGDLSNHNTKSTILPDKQTRQESKLMWVDLNLNHFVYWWLVINRYWFFRTDTDYLYVYVPDNRYAEPTCIYCYKVNK